MNDQIYKVVEYILVKNLNDVNINDYNVYGTYVIMKNNYAEIHDTMVDYNTFLKCYYENMKDFLIDYTTLSFDFQEWLVNMRMRGNKGSYFLNPDKRDIYLEK